MLFFIGLFVIVVGTIYFAVQRRSAWMFFMGIIFGPVFVFSACMLLAIPVQMLIPYQEAHYGLALYPTSAKTGQYLQSGKIDSTDVYSFVYGDNKHGLVKDHANADMSTVLQDSAKVDSRVTVTEYSGYNWFVSPFHFRLKNTTAYEFHVPLGSVDGGSTVG